ncbi:MAG: hypothetical protein ACF788_00600, partial [Novipirellula sp. JB048]
MPTSRALCHAGAAARVLQRVAGLRCWIPTRVADPAGASPTEAMTAPATSLAALHADGDCILAKGDLQPAPAEPARWRKKKPASKRTCGRARV